MTMTREQEQLAKWKQAVEQLIAQTQSGRILWWQEPRNRDTEFDMAAVDVYSAEVCNRPIIVRELRGYHKIQIVFATPSPELATIWEWPCTGREYDLLVEIRNAVCSDARSFLESFLRDLNA